MYVIDQKQSYFSKGKYVGTEVRKVASDLDQTGSYRLFATITFQKVISLESAIDHSSFLWRRVHRQVMGRRRKKFGRASFTGIAIVERAFIHAGKFGGESWHVHTLIEDHDCLPRNDLLASMAISSWLFHASQNLKVSGNTRLVSGKGLDVRPVHDQLGLCNYLSKQSWRPDWSWHDNVKVLRGPGLI
jgi:hypothetical protein